MKSKSPFQKSSPLNAYQYADTGEYASNASAKVIMPIAGAEIAKAVIAGASTIGEAAITAKARKKGSKTSELKAKTYKEFKDDLPKTEKPSTIKEFGDAAADLNTNLNSKDFSRFTNKGLASSGIGFKSPLDFSGVAQAAALAGNQGSINPYSNVNPDAFSTSQQQEQVENSSIPLGVGASDSNTSARPIDLAAVSDPYSTSGADFNPQSKMKAESIFGSAGQRQGLMNLGTPLHDKGHANDYEGHTHRKKGGSYREGDYMDETDMETSYPKLYTQDVGEIKRDKKSQFMVSKNEDYNPTKVDTIRPSKGKEFKMGWGDAERNISTNPKFKKSN